MRKTLNDMLGGPDVPGEATDKARSLLAVITQLHLSGFDDEVFADSYSSGVCLVLSQVDALLAEDAKHLETYAASRRDR